MSGGFFDYKDQLIDEILYKLRLEIALSRRRPDWTNEWSNYSEDFVREMGKVYNLLVEARARLHCIDWVLSGDISENTYHRRLADDLRKIELDNPDKDETWLAAEKERIDEWKHKQNPYR
jgi:hypothetical protein